jgi:GMP synthase (glutamine-hydrolysing)
MSPIQAAEFRQDGGTFWGVQYHPEFSLRLIATILRRHSKALIERGFRRDEAETISWIADLDALDADPARRDLAWAHGLDEEVLDPVRRVTELRNFLEMRVKPEASLRGRA